MGSNQYALSGNYAKSGDRVHIDYLGAERAYFLAYEALKKKSKRLVNSTPDSRLKIIPKVP